MGTPSLPTVRGVEGQLALERFFATKQLVMQVF
jgi:hypothetical protein